ncbi:MAG: UTP--glucose-1-phosphate uridylyltransferase GalU [Magnetococcales bacterium]|nr:UTP--glucose-1-phosphate uridylyltransferase GalU [Magnetococcales bacterium]
MKIRKAVLPVAGLGTRFLPATKAVPKEMLPVVDKPLIQYAVEEALAAGVSQVILVNSRDKGALEDHFDRAPELEEHLRSRKKYDLLQLVLDTTPEQLSVASTRQINPMGLGHAVWCARDLVGDEPFAVILPDDLVRGDTPVLQQMTQCFETLQCSMVAVEEVPACDTNKYGIIDPAHEQDGLVLAKGLVEKPDPALAPSRLALIGRYILTPGIFDLLGGQSRGAGGEIQLTDAMARLLEKESVYGFRFQGVRYDCGHKAGFQLANLALALERDDLRPQMLPFLKQQLARWS